MSRPDDDLDEPKMTTPIARQVVNTTAGPILVDKLGRTWILAKIAPDKVAWMPIPVAMEAPKIKLAAVN